MNAPIIPGPTAEDRLPHDRAVWRTEIPLQPIGNRPVSVDYGAGAIECTTGEQVDWAKAKRWRFGHPPLSSNPYEGLGLAAKE